MKAFNLIRAPEWWGFKLPPLLAVGYASALLSGSELYRMAPLFLFFLGSLAIGAVYVSVVNDMTDIAEDTAVGKKNRVAQLSPRSEEHKSELLSLLRLSYAVFCLKNK